MRTLRGVRFFITSGEYVQDRSAPSGTPHVAMRRYYNKNLPAQSSQINTIKNMAEREGFEPSKPCGLPLFESGQFNHSCTSPRGLLSL